MARKRQPGRAAGNSEESPILDQLVAVGELELESNASIEGVLLQDMDLEGAEASSVSLTEAALRKVGLGGTKLAGLHLREVNMSTINAANGRWPFAEISDVTIEDSTLVGLDLANGELTRTTFRRCKLDLLNLRMSSLEDVVLSGCSLRGADFYGAKLTSVSFEDCELEEADFTQATLEMVDLRSSTLENIRGVGSLKGATVDPRQLIDLAQSLAGELGIEVQEA